MQHLKEARKAGKEALREASKARRYERRGMVLEAEIARRRAATYRGEVAHHIREALFSGEVLGLGDGPTPAVA